MFQENQEPWIKYSEEPSKKSYFIKNIVRLVIKLSHKKKLEDLRKSFEFTAKTDKIPTGFTVKETLIDGINCEWIRPISTKGNKTIIYIHGGGYILGSTATSRGFALEISKYIGERVLSVGYKLAPENPFPCALKNCFAVYRKLLNEKLKGEDIVLIGDSAGGGLCLAMVLALKESLEPLPSAVVCISPWTDLAFTGESIKTNLKMDPIFCNGFPAIDPKAYAGKESLKNPLISPLYGDFHGFPPMLIHVGSDEILLDDSLRLGRKAREKGVDVSLKVWKGMWHVFPTFSNRLPEARQALREIADFVNKLP
jgi:acetyl esterase/lipase